MILLAFRHGLRASELCSLRWEQVDLAHARLHVSRLKSGIPSVHPLAGMELRALRRLQREQEPSRYLFLSERGAPMVPITAGSLHQPLDLFLGEVLAGPVMPIWAATTPNCSLYSTWRSFAGCGFHWRKFH